MADRLGGRHTVIVGKKRSENEVTLREMKTGAQERVSRDGLIAKLLSLSSLA